MIGLLWSILAILVSPCRSNARLEAENAVLRRQLLVLRAQVPGQGSSDQLRSVDVCPALSTVSIRPPGPSCHPTRDARSWHRAGFRSYWRWKSRNRGGRRQIDTDLRALIRQMTLENPLWGA